MVTRTRIRGGIIVAFDGTGHRLLHGGCLDFAGDRILHVGREPAVPADRVIDAAGKLVIPGQISAHAHVSANEAARPLLDGGRRDVHRNGFLNYVPTRGPGGRSVFAPVDRAASVRFGLAQLLRNGVTTVVAFDGAADTALIDGAAEFGLRLYTAPACNGGAYHFDDRGRLHRVIDEAAGFVQLEQALRFIERHHGAADDRIRGILVVDELYNTPLPLLRAAAEAARARGLGLTMHVCENLYEFHDTLRSTGRTPVELLDEAEILGPGVILAHCLYVSGHSLAAHPHGDDLGRLARAGAAVAHAPVVFARRGLRLESFPRYRDAGITLALGTDTFPMDLFEEMKVAAIAGKLVEGNHERPDAAEIFSASNLGGAAALRRPDLGRLAPGAKADIVLVDLDNPWMAPVADPIRTLVHCGHGAMVDTVIVDGLPRVEGGRILGCDETALRRAAEASAAAVWAAYPAYHWASRSLDDAFPPSFPRWD